VPERMCATPVDKRDLDPSHSNDPGRHPSRSPERERSSNNQGETARSSDRERSHNQGNSSASERSCRAWRRNSGDVSYPSLENGSRDTLPPPYATLPPPGENRIPIVLRRQDTNPPPYTTTAPSGSENRMPIVLRRPHSSPLLPNADPLSPWQRNCTPPMARQYTLPFRPRTRPDSRNYNIRTPQFIPYANQRGNLNFEPARIRIKTRSYIITIHPYILKKCAQGARDGHRFQRCLQWPQCPQCVECVQCRQHVKYHQYSRCGIDIDSHERPQTGHPGPVARVRKAEMHEGVWFNEEQVRLVIAGSQNQGDKATLLFDREHIFLGVETRFRKKIT